MGKSKLVDEIGHFTTFPNWAIDMGEEIGTDGLVLLLVLRYHSGDNKLIFPSYDSIQKHSGLNRHQIAKAIRKLEALGIVERKKRFGQSTIYRLKNLLPPASSADSALMDDPPVVPDLHQSSAESALSVVPNMHLNKTHLTRLNKQDKEDIPPVLDSTLDVPITQMLANSSGLVCFPADQLEYQETVRSIGKAYGVEKATEAMKEACGNWRIRKTKDNRPYRVTNLAWINDAVEALSQNGATKPYHEMTADERVDYLLAGGKPS